MSQQPQEVKVVMLGDSGVGKSCIVTRFVKGEYDTNIQSTIGASFQSKTLTIGGDKIMFQIWDTAGQEKYDSLAPIYYKGSQVAIVVYDVTEARTFQKIQKWITELQEEIGHEIIIAIVGNKIDMDDQQQVDYKDAYQYSQNKGVDDLFEHLAHEIIKQNKIENQENNHKLTESKKQKKQGCC